MIDRAKLGAKVGDPESTPGPRLDFGKLLGFATLSDRASESVDFLDGTLGAKLGAKVGIEEVGPIRGAEPKTVDFGRLLGFNTVGGQIAQSLDFQDETIGDKLGAKIGAEDISD